MSAAVAWIIARDVAKGRVRVGVAGGRFVAELSGKRVELPNSDILSLEEVAATRWMAALVAPLRDGGYAHLLGGKIGLLPGEARTLKEVIRNTPEGLAIRRACLVAALDAERGRQSPRETSAATGLIHHTDGLDAEISPARQMLVDFDRAHPQVQAGLAGGRKADGAA